MSTTFKPATEGQRTETTLVPDPESAPIVRLIFEWYVFGGQDDERPLTQAEIARRLRGLGVPRPSARKGFGSPDNCRWSQGMIYKILGNSTYRGIYLHGQTVVLPKEYDTQPAYERRAYRDPDDIIPVRLPDDCVIVPDAIWQAAQDKMAHNKAMRNRQRPGRHIYLLSGYIICPHCKRHITGAGNPKRGQFYYRCCDIEHTCPASKRNMNAGLLEARVLDILRTELAEPRLSANLEQLHARRTGDANLTRERIAHLEKAIEDEKKGIDRLVARYENTDDPDVIESINRRLADRKRLLTGYRDELAKANATLERLDLTPEREHELHELAAGILNRLEGNPTPEQIRAILSALRVQISLNLVSEPIVVTMSWCLGTEVTFYFRRDSRGHTLPVETGEAHNKELSKYDSTSSRRLRKIGSR